MATHARSSGDWHPGNREACHLKDNDWAMNSQFIGGVTPLTHKNKLKFTGTDKVCRPQENSCLAVSISTHSFRYKYDPY